MKLFPFFVNGFDSAARVIRREEFALRLPYITGIISTSHNVHRAETLKKLWHSRIRQLFSLVFNHLKGSVKKIRQHPSKRLILFFLIATVPRLICKCICSPGCCKIFQPITVTNCWLSFFRE